MPERSLHDLLRNIDEDLNVRRINGRSQLTKAIRSYSKLSKRLPIGCRLIEADKLFSLAKNWASDSQREKVFELLLESGSHGLMMECTCESEDCDSMAENDDGMMSCHCIDEASFGCGQIRLSGATEDGHAIRLPRSRSR